jgi:hypothetical protein
LVRQVIEVFSHPFSGFTAFFRQPPPSEYIVSYKKNYEKYKKIIKSYNLAFS